MAVLLGSATAEIRLDYSQFMQGVRTVEGGLNDLANMGGKGSTGFLDRMTGSALNLGAALLGPVSLGIGAAASLEKAMAGLNASLGGLDTSTLDQLSASIRQIGADSQYSAVEVAGVADTLAKAGFDADDLLGGMTQAVVDLAQATGDGLQPAVDGIVQAMSVWSPEIVDSTIAMTDAARVADIFTVAANQSSAGIGDIIAGMRPLGPVAASLGIGFDEAAAAVAMFTNYGLSGADAGISLARGLQELADPTSTAAAEMERLGVTAFDLSTGAFVGFPDLFRQLQVAMADMTDQQKITTLGLIFGAESMDVMGLAALTGADSLEEMIAMMGESGAAAEQSALRMDNLSDQFDALTEGAMSLLGSFMEGVTPALRMLVDFGNQAIDVLMGIPRPVKSAIGAVAGLLALFAGVNIGVGAFGAVSTAMTALGIGAGAATLSLGGLLGLLTAITAAVGGLYVAWQADFLGMQGIVDQFLAPLRTVGRRIHTAFRGVMAFVDRFRAAFSGIERPLNAVTETVTGFTDLIGGGLSRVRDAFAPLLPFTDALTTATAGVANSLSSLGDAAGYVVGPLDDISGFFQQTSDAATGLGRVFDALAVAVEGVNGGRIPDWLSGLADGFRAASDLVDVFMSRFTYMRDFLLSEGSSPVEAFLGAIRSALGAVNIGQILLTVGSWAFNALVDVGGALFSWVTGTALPAVGSAIGTIASVTVAIGGWLFETAEDLWTALATWWTSGSTSGLEGDGTGGSRPTGGAQVQLGTVTANIADWAFTAAVSLASSVATWVSDNWGAVGEVPGDVVKIALGTFDADVDGLALMAAVDAAVSDALSADGTQQAQLEEIGRRHGEGLGQDLFRGLIGGLFSGGGGGGDGSSGLFLPTSPQDIINSWLQPYLDGLIEGVVQDIRNIEWPDIAIPSPDFSWPEMPGVWEVPLIADATGFFGDLVDEIEQAWDRLTSINLNPLDWDWGALLPEPEWPDWLTTVPQWWKNIQAGRLPWDDGGGMSLGGNVPDDYAANWGNPSETDLSGWAGGRGNPDHPLNIPPAPDDGDVAAWSNLAAQIDKARLAAAMATGTFDTTKLAIQGFGADVGPAFAGVEDAITGSLTRAQFRVASSMSAISSAMSSGATLGVTAVGSALAPLPGIVEGVSTRAQFAAVQGGTGIATGFGTGSSRAPALVGAALSGIPGIISGVGTRAQFAAFSAGANISGAFASGIRSRLGEIQAAAAQMVAAAEKAVLAAAMISSPSRLFWALGEYIPQGFAGGIESGYPLVASASAGMVHVPGRYAGPAYGSGGGAASVTHNRPVTVNVTVEGNVSTEQDLTVAIASAMWEAERGDSIRHRVAAGVMPA